MTRPRLRRARDGRWELRLTAPERDLLRALPAQVLHMIATDDPSVRRLFPPAYAEDAKEEAEYRRLMGDQLLESHRGALRMLEETVDAERLDDEQLQAWLGALNDLRLVLGTSLDVTEHFEEVSATDPRASALATYAYLSMLQERVVEALADTR